MGQFSFGVLLLFLAGAGASWVLATRVGLRALRAGGSNAGLVLRWVGVVAWPFALPAREGASERDKLLVSRASIVFFVCMMLAVATISVGTNLHRIYR